MNNYHTHTFRCKHASGTVSDYVSAAREAGIQALGISDHTPLPDNRWLFVRMEMDELDDYCDEIEKARDNFSDITILKGLECDWDKNYENFYSEELLGEKKFDYLIGAVHWFPYHGEWLSAYEIENAKHLTAYSGHLIKMMESGLFSFTAHPDLFGAGYKAWDENARSCAMDIITAAQSLSMILEINGYGLRKPSITLPEGTRKQYPLLPFWELAGKSDITALCNSDAHEPADVSASLKEAERIAEDFSVKTIEELILPDRCRA